MSLPIVKPTHEPLTLAEARLVGASANRIANLRGLLARARGGSISVQTDSGTVALTLARVEIEALLELLIERDTATLAFFNVETTE